MRAIFFGILGFSLTVVIVPRIRGAEIRLEAKDTLSVAELDHGDTIRFRLSNGDVRTFELVATAARVLFTNIKQPKKAQPDGGTVYEMTCTLRVDGEPLELRRYVCTQEAFYEPYVINGVRLWFDAVADVEAFVTFEHGDCRPHRQARFALQDATRRICPDELLPWYHNTARYISIGDTNNGDDCWMGPFCGVDAHGGLDINQPAGAFNFTPLAFDDHFLFESLAKGNDNNRWRGIRRWPNGDTWMLQTHHLLAMLVPEHTAVAAGTPFCTAAGVKYGAHQHSHYNFKIQPAGADTIVDLDPWILFWQIFEDQKRRGGDLHAGMAPLAPVRVGAVAAFSAAASRPGPGRKRIDAIWMFGDGGGATGIDARHMFAAPGVYPITLTVTDGSHWATTTQHLTVQGAKTTQPVLALHADEPSFRPRPKDAMDVYGIEPTMAPLTLELVARLKHLKPRPREIQLVNLGAGVLAQAQARVNYITGGGWLSVERDGAGNTQSVRVAVDATGLSPARYSARVTIEAPGVANDGQVFWVSLLVPTHPAMPPVSRRVQQPLEKIVDDTSPGFYATPWFWIGHRFANIPRGYRGFHLLNGERPREGEFVRFTPDLEAGRYEVRLAADTPFAPGVRFAVRVRHASGEERRWVEPAVSRRIGTFAFDDGTDGFVEILAAGSSGQVLADALFFKRVDRAIPASPRP
jgi:hypothetical protein